MERKNNQSNSKNPSKWEKKEGKGVIYVFMTYVLNIHTHGLKKQTNKSSNIYKSIFLLFVFFKHTIRRIAL